MINAMKKAWLLWLIIGTIVFGLGLFLVINYYISEPHSTVITWGENNKLDLMLLVSGILVGILAWMIIFPSYKKSHGGYRVIYALELIIVSFVAVYGFIIPFFLDLFGIQNKAFTMLNVNQWYGLIFWVHGSLKLSQCAFSTVKNKGVHFLLGLAAVSFGVWLFFNGPQIEHLQIVVAFAVTIIGLFMLVTAFAGISERKRSTK